MAPMRIRLIAHTKSRSNQLLERNLKPRQACTRSAITPPAVTIASVCVSETRTAVA